MGVPSQAPPLQTSPLVQLLPSSQLSVLWGLSQPWRGSQTSSVQTLPSSQSSVPVATQAPSSQYSLVVQTVLSLHRPSTWLVTQAPLTQALSRQSVLGGQLATPSSSTVPSQSLSWPSQTSGSALGAHAVTRVTSSTSISGSANG